MTDLNFVSVCMKLISIANGCAFVQSPLVHKCTASPSSSYRFDCCTTLICKCQQCCVGGGKTFDINTFFFVTQDSPVVSDVQEFFKKHVIPLVGHRKPSNDAKRYTKRPLVVVYYGVDFSFDYRKGE